MYSTPHTNSELQLGFSETEVSEFETKIKAASLQKLHVMEANILKLMSRFGAGSIAWRAADKRLLRIEGEMIKRVCDLNSN